MWQFRIIRGKTQYFLSDSFILQKLWSFWRSFLNAGTIIHNWRPCWNQVEICPKFLQVLTRNSPTWYMVYSKLFHGFVKNVTYISRPFPNQAKVWLRFPHLQSLGCVECLLWCERGYESHGEVSFILKNWFGECSHCLGPLVPWPMFFFGEISVILYFLSHTN